LDTVDVSVFVRADSDYLASASSFCIAILLLCCYAFKHAALIDIEDIQDTMAAEQRSLYTVDQASLTIIAVGSIVGTLLVCALLFAVQTGIEAQRARDAARSAQYRRLRYVGDGIEVELGTPVIPEKAPSQIDPTHVGSALSVLFHLFLSHVWGTGQDQMRIIKQRLLEMLPDVCVFLE
jgi:hypothetical protein